MLLLGRKVQVTVTAAAAQTMISKATAHRYFLAKALEAWVAEGGKPKSQLRLGRRLPMYEFALEPLRDSMSKAVFRYLILCLSGASAIETYIALKDICGLDDQAADEVSWSIISAILDKAGVA